MKALLRSVGILCSFALLAAVPVSAATPLDAILTVDNATSNPRAEDAVYGGEMSAHHYFRDFAYCDSGMIPWLLVCELISVSGKSLSRLVSERMAAYPCSGEINNTVAAK